MLSLTNLLACSVLHNSKALILVEAYLANNQLAVVSLAHRRSLVVVLVYSVVEPWGNPSRTLAVGFSIASQDSSKEEHKPLETLYSLPNNQRVPSMV